MTRISIVADHPLIRDGFGTWIGSQRDLQVCGSAGRIQETLQQIAKSPPDVLVADLSLKDGPGLDPIKTVKKRSPQVGLLVVSAVEEEHRAQMNERQPGVEDRFLIR